MKIVTGLMLLAIASVSCVKLPTQTGTWVGVAESITLYTAQGEPNSVTCLRLHEGPTMRDRSLRKGYLKKSALKDELIAPCPILVNRQRVAFGPTNLVGKRLRIQGTITIGNPKDPIRGAELVRDTPGYNTDMIKSSPAILKTDEEDMTYLSNGSPMTETVLSRQP